LTSNILANVGNHALESWRDRRSDIGSCVVVPSHATGQNVIVLDRKDSPDVEGAGGDST